MSLSITGSTGGVVSVVGGLSGTITKPTSRKFTILIGGADKSRYILNPSIYISSQLGRATCSFTVIPKDGVNYAPELWDEIILIHNASNTRLFAGYVESTSRIDLGGTSGHYTIQVQCSDYSQIADRHLVGKWYTIANGGFAGIIAFDIVDLFMQDTGVTFVTNTAANAPVGNDITYNWVTVSEALNDLAARGNLEWRIDNYKNLFFISKDTGYTTSPFSIVQNDGNWRSMIVNTTKTNFWNSVKVRSSQDVASLWTDIVEANGSYIYFTTYPQTVVPVISVDGTDVDPAVVCELGDVGTTPGWEWYYIKGNPGIFYNQSLTPPSSGDINISYPSRLSYVAIARDEESIAEVGEWVHIEEAKDVTTLDALQQYADSLLARGSVAPVNLTIETDRVGLEPGQLLTVNANGVDGDFLIEQVDMREEAKDYPRWSIQASNAPQRANRGTTFFSKLITSARQPIDRVDSAVSFTLAETINGQDNPGLEVITPAAYGITRKSGYIKMIRLGFGSIATGTATSDDIEIDVLRNGTSIFGSKPKLILKAGRTTPVTCFVFDTQPYWVEAGDNFTLDILQADSTAKDGFLSISIVGGY